MILSCWTGLADGSVKSDDNLYRVTLFLFPCLPAASQPPAPVSPRISSTTDGLHFWCRQQRLEVQLAHHSLVVLLLIRDQCLCVREN